jgi:hypothetical protein
MFVCECCGTQSDTFEGFVDQDMQEFEQQQSLVAY